MKIKSLKLLRICVLVLGWLLIAGVLMGVLGQANRYNKAQNDMVGYMTIVAGEFKIGSALEWFFSGFGNAFLAFLIAAVLRMIERQAPVGIEYANRLMVVCCFSYLANALIQFHDLIKSFFATLKLTGGFYWWLLPTELALWVPAIAPILYTAAIYALYRYFTTMVEFESEVA
jgi:hypothetical protein